MTFELEFDPRAWKEWKKLGDTVRQQFKKKLAEVLERPRVEANRLHGLPDCYKIKLMLHLLDLADTAEEGSLKERRTRKWTSLRLCVSS